MKPRTILERDVFDIHKYLSKITKDQKQWAYKECLEHKGFSTKKDVTCMDCGYSFSLDLVKRKRAVCPHCETKIKVEYSRKSTDRQINYFAITTVCCDYQVVRNFELIADYKKGHKVRYNLREILQYWITPKEKVVMLGLLHHTQGYCDSWSGKWAIRKENGYHNKYDVYARKYHPDSTFKKEYTRIGINHKLQGLTVLEAIKILPYNPQAETLLKAKQYELLSKMADYPRNLYQYWPSVKICLRNKYKVKDASLWKDYIDLLRYFNKDLRNAKYVCPKNLKKEHDRLVEKKRNIQRKEEIKLKRKKVRDSQIEYAKSKKPFMGLSFTKGKIQVRFLNSVQEVMEEGDELKHCVFASNYYERSTLLFSALVDGKKTATVEVDPQVLKVIQLRGKHNNRTQYDDKIKAVVNDHMNVIAEKAKMKSNLKTAS